MEHLKEKTIRGGFTRLTAQGVNFVVRIGSLILLARLLDPKDFGLVGMVTAFTGVLSLFRDFGLSSAAVQRGNVTHAQASTLFWINLAIGALLALTTVAASPVIAAFYAEPRLVAVSVALASGFVLNAAGVQHSVMLQRELRFTALSVINTVSLVTGAALAIAGALVGYGYWALVIMAIATPLVNTIGCWATTAWVPGPPQRRVGMRSLARFGGTVTLNSLVYYGASNFDKVLIGRFWGAEALGLYGRAYQLISIPTDNLNVAAGEVAFSALSRLQNDPERLRSYFLKGYSLLLTLTLPATIACGVFADDVVVVLLGANWKAAAPIFRLLAPAMVVFAIVNPLGWVLAAMASVGRGLKMALVLAPFMVAAYIAGLAYGPTGVAAGYSMVMLLWLVPAIAWVVHGTPLSFRDVTIALIRPLTASLLASAGALGVGLFCGYGLSPLPRLVLESLVLAIVFSGLLWFVMGQKPLYLDLFRNSKSATRAEDAVTPVRARES
jgi:O-antigen/teichoic acid export membrane protein